MKYLWFSVYTMHLPFWFTGACIQVSVLLAFNLSFRCWVVPFAFYTSYCYVRERQGYRGNAPSRMKDLDSGILSMSRARLSTRDSSRGRSGKGRSSSVHSSGRWEIRWRAKKDWDADSVVWIRMRDCIQKPRQSAAETINVRAQITWKTQKQGAVASKTTIAKLWSHWPSRETLEWTHNLVLVWGSQRLAPFMFQHCM